MDEPEKFAGKQGTRVKDGVKWAASILAPFGFQIVDQISEAATLDKEVKSVEHVTRPSLSIYKTKRRMINSLIEKLLSIT